MALFATYLRPALVRALGWVLVTLLRVLAATWRTDSTASERLPAGDGTPQLVGFWHGKYFALLALLRGTRGCVVIGAGFRGEVIAAICESLGYTPVLVPRGDREQALREIRAALRAGLSATALDGPVGPARRVKRTLLGLAAEVGAQIRPVSVAAAPQLVLGWRWDRREIPLPFARVRLVVGEPIRIPKAASDRELEEWQLRVTRGLDELERVGAKVRLRRTESRQPALGAGPNSASEFDSYAGSEPGGPRDRGGLQHERSRSSPRRAGASGHCNCIGVGPTAEPSGQHWLESRLGIRARPKRAGDWRLGRARRPS